MNEETAMARVRRARERRSQRPSTVADLLFNAAKLTAAAAAAGPFFMAAKQAAAAELASTSASAGDPIAVSARDRGREESFRGQKISAIDEAGPQALDPKIVLGGRCWKKLTGVNVGRRRGAVRRHAYTKSIAEHLAKSGAFDVIDASPGMDARLRRPRRDRPDRRAGQRSTRRRPRSPTSTRSTARCAKYKGKTWGFFDDGDDVHPLLPQGHLRRPEAEGGVQGEVQARPARADSHGTSSTRPRKFITDQLAPKVYGASAWPRARQPGN